MNSLEQIVLQDFGNFNIFFTNFLDLGTTQQKEVNSHIPTLFISDNLNYYGALEFSKENHYQWHYKPEAAQNPLARAEENGHYFNLALNPKHKKDLIEAEKGSDTYLKLEYRAEYIARLMALIYLNHKGIQEYNQVFSNIEKGRIILSTEPLLDIKAHYLGYTKAENDFKNLTPRELEKKLKRILFGDSLSEFNDIYRPQPQIVEIR